MKTYLTVALLSLLAVAPAAAARRSLRGQPEPLQPCCVSVDARVSDAFCRRQLPEKRATCAHSRDACTAMVAAFPGMCAFAADVQAAAPPACRAIDTRATDEFCNTNCAEMATHFPDFCEVVVGAGADVTSEVAPQAADPNRFVVETRVDISLLIPLGKGSGPEPFAAKPAVDAMTTAIARSVGVVRERVANVVILEKTVAQRQHLQHTYKAFSVTADVDIRESNAEDASNQVQALLAANLEMALAEENVAIEPVTSDDVTTEVASEAVEAEAKAQAKAAEAEIEPTAEELKAAKLAELKAQGIFACSVAPAFDRDFAGNHLAEGAPCAQYETDGNVECCLSPESSAGCSAAAFTPSAPGFGKPGERHGKTMFANGTLVDRTKSPGRNLFCKFE